MSRFVRPETRTLVLANGDRLTVRKRLTAGETRAQYARMYSRGEGRDALLLSGMGLIVAYLLDWDFRDDDDRPVVIRDLSPDELATVIDSLDLKSFHEIKTAIEAHEKEMQAERADEKKTVGASALSPT